MSARPPQQIPPQGHILRFRPRLRPGKPSSAGSARGRGEQPAIGDLANFEQSPETDDYRHRMIVNSIAFLFILFLTGAGIWLAEAMALMRKNQDCVFSGRRNCVPIEINTNLR